MEKNCEKKMGAGKKAAIGVGIAAIVAAAAGTFFLYGTKKGAKTRKQIKGWMLKAKGEILEKIEDAKDLSQETYNKIVDEIQAKYKAVKSIDAKDLADFSKEMKSHWKGIQGEIKKKIKPAKKVSRKNAKKK